jgi:hypothetical protein
MQAVLAGTFSAPFHTLNFTPWFAMVAKLSVADQIIKDNKI